MKIDQMKQIEVEAKTLKLHLKVCDRFAASLEDQDGKELFNYDDYVPDFMPGEHFGDYVILDIDIDTGKIINWKQPTKEQIQNWIGGGEND